MHGLNMYTFWQYEEHLCNKISYNSLAFTSVLYSFKGFRNPVVLSVNCHVEQNDTLSETELTEHEHELWMNTTTSKPFPFFHKFSVKAVQTLLSAFCLAHCLLCLFTLKSRLIASDFARFPVISQDSIHYRE